MDLNSNPESYYETHLCIPSPLPLRIMNFSPVIVPIQFFPIVVQCHGFCYTPQISPHEPKDEFPTALGNLFSDITQLPAPWRTAMAEGSHFAHIHSPCQEQPVEWLAILPQFRITPEGHVSVRTSSRSAEDLSFCPAMLISLPLTTVDPEGIPNKFLICKSASGSLLSNEPRLPSWWKPHSTDWKWHTWRMEKEVPQGNKCDSASKFC